MGQAWVQRKYWLTYYFTGTPCLQFDIPIPPFSQTIRVWKFLDPNIRFDVIRAQLDEASYILLVWKDSTKEITEMHSLKV